MLKCLLLILFIALPTFAQSSFRDGQRDFDFEIGTWKTHIRRLLRPLSGQNNWVEYEGTTVVSKVLDGRANLAELKVFGSGGLIEGVGLRLYNPMTRKWTMHYANIGNGQLTTPLVGEFRNGRGEFSAMETQGGRQTLIRFLIIKVSDDQYRFEQSYSDDGGKTFELNWVAVDTRVK